MDSDILGFIIYIIISLVMAILLTKLYKGNFETSIEMFLLWPIGLIILFFNFIIGIPNYKLYCNTFGYKKCYLIYFIDQ